MLQRAAPYDRQVKINAFSFPLSNHSSSPSSLTLCPHTHIHTNERIHKHAEALGAHCSSAASFPAVHLAHAPLLPHAHIPQLFGARTCKRLHFRFQAQKHSTAALNTQSCTVQMDLPLRAHRHLFQAPRHTCRNHDQAHFDHPVMPQTHAHPPNMF